MIGQNIKRARAALGLKGETLAADAGMSRAWLSQIENGKPVGARTLHRLAVALHTTPEALTVGVVTLPPILEDTPTARLRRLTKLLQAAGLTTLADEAGLLVVEVAAMERFCDERAGDGFDVAQAVARGEAVDIRPYLP